MLGTLRLASVDISVTGIINALQACQSRGLDILVGNAIEKVSAIRPQNKPHKKKWCSNHGLCWHSTKECKGIIKENKSLNNYSFSISMDWSFSQMVNLLGCCKVNALLDTGADTSCISSKLAERLKIKTTSVKKISGFNGSYSIGKWTTPVAIEVKNEKLFHKLLVIDNLSYPLIIGKEILI